MRMSLAGRAETEQSRDRVVMQAPPKKGKKEKRKKKKLPATRCSRCVERAAQNPW